MHGTFHLVVCFHVSRELESAMTASSDGTLYWFNRSMYFDEYELRSRSLGVDEYQWVDWYW